MPARNRIGCGNGSFAALIATSVSTPARMPGPSSDTVSWVVLTAFAILALNQLPCSCCGLEHLPFRLDRGIAMLMDRVRPGWRMECR